MRAHRLSAVLLAAIVLTSCCGIGPNPADDDRAVERWMLERRAYPGTAIPPDARRRAFRAVTAAASGEMNEVWMSMGPAPVASRGNWIAATGRVTALVVSPADRRTIVAGTSSGGIWRSTDGGATFAPVADDQADLSVGAIAIAPSNPNTLYAGMGEDHLGTGVLKSTDFGATWHLVTDGSFAAHSSTKKIVVDPLDENVVWLLQSRSLAGSSVSSTNNVLKSIDGGVTWQKVFDGVVDDIAIVGSAVLAGAVRQSLPGTGGIYRSTDGGSTWTSAYAAGDPDVPPDYYLATSGGTAFAIALESIGGVAKHQLLASTDDGAHWNRVADSPPDVGMFFFAACPSDPQTLILGGVGLHRSTDGGKTWTTIPTHPDQRSIAFDPGSRTALWIGNDGGLFRSEDGLASLTSFADRLPVVQFYSVVAHPTDASLLFGGAQDNGFERQNAGTQQWNEILGGDFGTAVFDASGSRVIANGIAWQLYRWSANGDGKLETISTSTTFGDGSRINFIAPMAQGRDGTVWFGTYRLFASRDFGTTWIAPAGTKDLTAGKQSNGRADVLTAIGPAPSDASVLYTGSAAGAVMVTHDGGVNWTDVTPPVHRSVSAIAVSRTSAATAWVAYSGYGAGQVMKTSDFGATWTDASDGLPQIPVDAIYAGTDGATLYAGMDIGAFRRTPESGRWTWFNRGMPAVIVTSFTTTADGRLVAATYGRGAYELVPIAPAVAGPRRH